MLTKDRIYFPNLNGLRFIAALLVIVHHIEQIKDIYGLPNNFSSSFIQIIGELGVILFFVLSGFLITYLLLEEESRTQTIAVKNFYLRRILRIWPLYFFIVFLALAVLPNVPMFVLPDYGKAEIYKDLSAKIFLYVFFLPNLVSPLLGVVPYASLTWSIGTEEQFYLLWAPLLKFVKRYRIALMFVIVFGYLLFARALFSDRTNFLVYKYEINAFWQSFNIPSMAIGGFFALLLHSNHRALKIFLNNYLFYFALVFTSIMLYRGVYFPHITVNDLPFPYLYKEFYSVWFGILILNFAANKNIFLSLEGRPIRYLGKISYGLYMYHPIAIVLALQTTGWLGSPSDAFLYPLTFALTILLAGVSYKYYESYFLNFKTNYTSIKSGDVNT
ncbi:MAG TPA: acyltransferase [Anaerolineales bacterium]|nr:acyltransferase [Anaerolineales bacterium]HMS00908.1 acyltransferase [Anaerolineales bacterium]HNQ95806.1 acyltransferase [Anaerolineales bacterium]HNS61070.1 acyltransferase [Anaerolineales bacterium]